MKIAVIAGGPSAEAEVSRASAKGVAKALALAHHDVKIIELDRSLPSALLSETFDVVFPVVHGAVGEDGSLQGLLEVLALPYVGSSVLASAMAMNKVTARMVFSAAKLPIAKGIALGRGDAKAAARRAREEVGRAIVIKPASGGSAIGVTRFEEAATEDEIAVALGETWKVDDVALVEHFAKGREVTCSILDIDAAPRALAATEIRSPNDAFYTYEARYAPGRSVHVCPAKFEEALTDRIHDIALRAHAALGCRDLSRVDFVVGDDDNPEAITLLEVNTLPGFTETSLYPEAARIAGFEFAALCDALVHHARKRGVTLRNDPQPFPK